MTHVQQIRIREMKDKQRVACTNKRFLLVTLQYDMYYLRVFVEIYLSFYFVTWLSETQLLSDT